MEWKKIIKLVSGPHVFDFMKQKDSRASFVCLSCKETGFNVYAKALKIAEGDTDNNPIFELYDLPSPTDHHCAPTSMDFLAKTFRELYKSVKAEPLLTISQC